MDRDEDFKVIRDLHPADLGESREKLHLFLCGWLGGPNSTSRNTVTPAQDAACTVPHRRDRARPVAGLHGPRTEDREVTGALRDFLDARFAHVADFMRNR